MIPLLHSEQIKTGKAPYGSRLRYRLLTSRSVFGKSES